MQAMDIIIMPLVRSIGAMNYFGPKVVPRKCYFDKLPLEVRGKIARTLFNVVIDQDAQVKKNIDQKKLKKYPLTMPTLSAICFAHDFCEMKKVCQSEIGGKKFLASALIVLPKQQRDAFARMANDSGLIFGNIRVDDYKIIEAMENKNIKNGLCLQVSHLSKTVETIQKVGAISIFMGLLMGSFMGSVGIDHTAHLVVRIMPIFGAGGGFSLMGLSEILNLFNSKYRKDDPWWSIEKINL